jgi:N4-gp56 family major capsid protein
MSNAVLTTTAQIDPAVQLFYDRTLLEQENPQFVHDIGADTKRRPTPNPNGGTQLKLRRYDRLARATTPLTEGVTPVGKQLSKNDILVTPQQYGDYITFTDVVSMTVEDATLTVAAQELGFQRQDTFDILMRDILLSTASSTTASTGGTVLNKTDIDGVVQTLLGRNAMFFTSTVVASTGVGTSPIRPSFWAIMHTDLIDDLEAVTNFRSTSEYGMQGGIHEAEWGATGNVRWLQTTQADQDGDSDTFYECLIFGRHAYGMVEIQGGDVKNIVKVAGSAGTNDPLNQRNTSGWKSWFGARILNDSWIHKLLVTNG